MTLACGGIVACLLPLVFAPASADWLRAPFAISFDIEAFYEDGSGDLWFVGSDRGEPRAIRFDGVQRQSFTDFARGNGGGATIHDVLLDARGALWFAVYNLGVQRRSASDVTWFEGADLPSVLVRELHEDQDGNIWVGTESGARFYNGFAWVDVPQLDAHYIDAIVEDRDRNLWFATRSGVVRRTPAGDWFTWGAEHFPNPQVQALLQDADGHIWAGTASGVLVFDGLGWRPFAIDGNAQRNVLALAQDRWSNLWFGSQSGLWRYDGVQWHRIPVPNVVWDQTQALHVDRRGLIWVASSPVGWSRFDGVWADVPLAAGAPTSVRVRETYRGANGQLWFGTDAGAVRADSTGFAAVDSLQSRIVYAFLEHQDGSTWFGTNLGIRRFDGTSWADFTMADGLRSNVVLALAQTPDGTVWAGTRSGATRLQGAQWTSNLPEGVGTADVQDLHVDRNGTLWFARNGSGVTRMLDGSWTTFDRQSSNLASDAVLCVVDAPDGSVWVGTTTGASRFSNGSWTNYAHPELGENIVDIDTDAAGNVYFASRDPLRGVARWDGRSFRLLETPERMDAVMVDAQARLWVGSVTGLSLHEPDRVPPRTILPGAPSGVLPNRLLRLTLDVGNGESAADMAFEYRLGEGAWTPAPASQVLLPGVPDDMYVLEARATDVWGNVDPVPARAEFEVDATAPNPVIVSPAFNQVVDGEVQIFGRAADARFAHYTLRVTRTGMSAGTTLVDRNPNPVDGGFLGAWDTRSGPDGAYDIHLTVRDTLGLDATRVVTVTVDNDFPDDAVTSPARVTAATGGDVYTTQGTAHAYFPPRAFDRDVQVTLTAVDASQIDDPVVGSPLYALDVEWTAGSLLKPGTLEVRAPSEARDFASETPRFYRRAGSTWKPLGGTFDAQEGTLSIVLAAEGRYAVGVGGEEASPRGMLSALETTPRVFSPNGAFADDALAIHFVLGQSGSVTVKVYNRAGRLVGEVASGETLRAGANLVRWDGRGRDGGFVDEGLYVVAVEALGERLVKTVAVVR